MSGKQQRQKFQPKPLTEDQILVAKEIIKESNPLDGYPMSSVFPILKPCDVCCSGKKTDNEQPLLPQKGGKGQVKKARGEGDISEEEKKQDPYLILGSGMIAYRDLMFTLIMVFSVLTIIMMPTFFYYQKYGAILLPKAYMKYSLGNMGYSSSQCTILPLGAGNEYNTIQVPVQCPFGNYSTAYAYGINPADMIPNNYCNITSVPEVNNVECSSYIDKNYVNNQIASRNQTTNIVTLTISSLLTATASLQAREQCLNSNNNFFIQFSCIQTEEALYHKFNELSIVSVIGLLSCFIYLTAIFYLKRDSKLMYMSWDVQTITPGDYSVEYQISSSAYQWFVDHVYAHENQNEVSPSYALKQYMKREIETLLNHELQECKSSGRINSSTCKINQVLIADIVFAYNNSELIGLLRQRGAAIAAQKYDKMREVEKQITEVKKNNYDAFTRPVCAFITFEEEDAYIIAQNFEQGGDRKATFLSEDLIFTEATEPTNIIWENRHFTDRERGFRTIHAVLVIFVLVLISFALIYFCKLWALQIAQKYPVVDVEGVNQSYGTELQNYAFLEYNKYYIKDNETGEISENSNYFFTGPLMAFCIDQGKTSLTSADTTLYNKTDPVTGEVIQSDPICQKIGEDYILAYALSNGVSYAIVAINYVLRLFIIKLIQYIGKPTESEQTQLITDGVFIVQFFNTALLLLAANANLQEQGAFFGFFFRGQIPDFNSLWFNDIGYSMLYAMMFNVFWPIMEFFAFWGLRLLFRILDRNIIHCSDMRTKKTTIQQYVELYSGPVYFIHYKYSSLLNITFVTFLYGLGIPMLFPAAVFQISILYLVEKLMIYYSYRQPPLYDNKLNDRVLRILTYAPLLFLAFGYWMVSNKQLIGNDIYFFNQANEVRQTGHVWTQVFKKEGYVHQPGFPLLVMFWFMLILTIFRNSLFNLWCRLFPNTKVGAFEIDEDLDNYFNTLDEHDRNWSILEEKNCRNVMNMKILTDETLARLEGTTMGKAHLQGVHTYDILANPLYLDDFQYFSADRDDRKECIVDDDEDEDNDNAQSDLVRMVLNLGFLTKEQAVNFTFDKNTYSQHCKGHKDKNVIN